MGIKENKVARGSIRTVMKHQMSYSGTKVPEFLLLSEQLVTK